MVAIGIKIQSYVIIAEANGYVMGKSPTAPSPYAVWQVDDDGNGVCCGHYFVDREEAEWDFCARAFEWFEDNMYIHMIENGEEVSETHCIFDHQTVKEQPLTDDLIRGLEQIRADLKSTAQLIDEMCAIVDDLKAGRRRTIVNNSND